MLEPEQIRRYERQVAAMLAAIDDPESFAIVVRLIDSARADGLPAAARRLRAVDGYSFADLARPLGVTRSAAAQRFR